MVCLGFLCLPAGSWSLSRLCGESLSLPVGGSAGFLPLWVTGGAELLTSDPYKSFRYWQVAPGTGTAGIVVALGHVVY